jgi:catechol 2,3-dioxygenase-like lactoylglutathione lyase family enzyme
MALDTPVSTPDIAGIAPLFIVRIVPAAIAFYRERLGFEITFQAPSDDDIFFGIVRRGAAMIMLKAMGVQPVPHRSASVGEPRRIGLPRKRGPSGQTETRVASMRGVSHRKGTAETHITRSALLRA